eukprot:Skav236000  [mRNA]  locus=scaffold348:439265:442676:+ [translate_table: standard]
MGFKNSVSLAQHIHRVLAKEALRRIGGGMEMEMRKDRSFSSSNPLFRIYLDNFDELRRVSKGHAAALAGQVSPLVASLREVYEEYKVPRHPKKGVAQQALAEVQGAIVDGEAGVIYPKPEKVLKYLQLTKLLLNAAECSQKQAQIVGGGLVYFAMFRRPLLGGLNHLWQFIVSFEGYPPVVKLPIPMGVKEELARMMALIPLAAIDLRCAISKTVTASDASTTGGGITASQKVTPSGAIAAQCSIRGDVVEPTDLLQVLTIGMFDGISGLRVAADSLGWNVAGHVSIEKCPKASRVVEARFPNTIHVSDVELVDEDAVLSWSLKFSQVGIVVIGAGPPCQGVSGLNASKKGALKDARSVLFKHVKRVRTMVRRAFPWAQVRCIMESVASMDGQDEAVMSADFEEKPFYIDAADVSLAHRPRLYWVDWEVWPRDDVQPSLLDSGRTKLSLKATLDERKFLTPGWSKVADSKFPTFTTSRPRPSPGYKPAGLHQCTLEEVQRWQADEHRFPPYQYRNVHCLQNKAGLFRMPNCEEREVMLGFPKGFTVQCLPKSQHGSTLHTDARMSMLGNSWNVTTVAVLLSFLGELVGLNPPLSVQAVVDRTSPGCTSNFQTFLTRPSLCITRGPSSEGNELQLVKKLMTLVGIKGDDLLLQSSSEDQVRYQRMRTLRELTVQPVTKARYENALQNFYQYLTNENLVLPHRMIQFDPMVADYVEFLWADGQGKTVASNTLAALQDKHPQLKGKLQESWRLRKTWSTHEVPNRAPPLPLDVLYAMVGLADFQENPGMALTLLLAYHGLLRTGELLSLKVQHVSISKAKGPAVLSLGLTKSGKRQGAAESVTVYNEDVCRRLFQWVSVFPAHTLLAGPSHAWRKQFAHLIEKLGFSTWDFRPYSLRRGGATQMFKSFGSFDRLLVSGRWQSARTARIYVNEGLAVLAEMTLPWTPFSRNLRAQYLKSLTSPLPKLEPGPLRSAQCRGTRKRKANKATNRKREPKKRLRR